MCGAIIGTVNDFVSVTLTERGAAILNRQARGLNDDTIFEEGDTYTAMLWEILYTFGGSRIGQIAPFYNLQASHDTP